MKKYGILLSKGSLIYYSWLFIILFIGLIIGYESTVTINWPEISLIIIFVISLGCSIFNSFLTVNYLKLPYHFKIKIKNISQMGQRWSIFYLYRVQTNSVGNYYFLSFNFKKKKLH